MPLNLLSCSAHLKRNGCLKCIQDWSMEGEEWNMGGMRGFIIGSQGSQWEKKVRRRKKWVLLRKERLFVGRGFCDESNEKVLMYEYASRGSLDLYLNSEDLSWVQSLRICIGAARGLEYLHNPGKTQQRVLHRDIKSSNILLNENWNAKISDLGLSKFGPANQQYTFLVSNTVGTIGYCDPLYVETGLLTKEYDVYSFGVVLFEILCGRLCIDNKNDKCRSLPRLVQEYYEQNKIKEIVYGNIKDEIESSSLEAFTTVAYQCLKRNLRERPSMTKVLRILENALRYQVSFFSHYAKVQYTIGNSTTGKKDHTTNCITI
ncbi:Protein kinase, ATP binding site-containing protein [Artemisia annua]|uniref:Protein kinase, ATP binding site-containing protein n=1 Tax=Artemisia annua TaxID=35608 RepID=A0A2U1NVI2_ARTAN|nr:Protein kinase, ATP binding site-containing protein [Artemisia annua]